MTLNEHDISSCATSFLKTYPLGRLLRTARSCYAQSQSAPVSAHTGFPRMTQPRRLHGLAASRFHCPTVICRALRQPDESGFSVSPSTLRRLRFLFADQPASRDLKVNRPRKRWPY